MEFTEQPSGVFAAYKPEGFTSFDVVAKLRGILKIKKIGHGGTLDPMATGVLPIFIGKATRAADMVADMTKRYVATAVFGQKTDTGDITGSIIEQNAVVPDRDALDEGLKGFLGKTRQIPPMYSAVKVGGKRLYEIARKGGTVERTPRQIEIFSITLLDYDEDKKEFTIDVVCSKGSYIRSLVEDIAGSLGALSSLKALKRTASGVFSEDDCLSFSEVESRVGAGDYSFLMPVDTLLSDFAEIRLTKEQERAFLNGAGIADIYGAKEGEKFKVYSEERFLAVVQKKDGRMVTSARFV